MAKKKKQRVAPPPVAPPANKDWQAEKLTGNRAQRGSLPNGKPRWVYEVVWKPVDGQKWKNTWEPHDPCLLGWEAELSAIDENILRRAKQAPINVAQLAQQAREQKAKEKAVEVAAARERLQRRQQRQKARAAPRASWDCDEDEEEEELEDEEEEDLEQEELAGHLLELEAQLVRLNSAAGIAQTAEAEAETTTAVATPDAATVAPVVAGGGRKQRQKRSRVWLAFCPNTNKCKLPHPEDRTRVCGASPGNGTGTSGHLAHLRDKHPKEWAHIQLTGAVKTSTEMIEDAFKAKTDQSKPHLGDKETDELHRLVALWVAKCGRPQRIVEDAQLNTLLARILELCRCRLRYELPCEATVHTHLTLLGVEGKAVARDFLVRLLRSGVKPTITGDLWSENGMGLFGIYAHGMTDTWVMEKVLIGLVACESERHTHENIKKWTDEALEGIGLTATQLL